MRNYSKNSYWETGLRIATGLMVVLVTCLAFWDAGVALTGGSPTATPTATPSPTVPPVCLPPDPVDIPDPVVMPEDECECLDDIEPPVLVPPCPSDPNEDDQACADRIMNRLNEQLMRCWRDYRDFDDDNPWEGNPTPTPSFPDPDPDETAYPTPTPTPDPDHQCQIYCNCVQANIDYYLGQIQSECGYVVAH